jgi:hypothetical protein
MAPRKGKATKAPPKVTPATPTVIPIRQDSPAWPEADTGGNDSALDALATAATAELDTGSHTRVATPVTTSKRKGM